MTSPTSRTSTHRFLSFCALCLTFIAAGCAIVSKPDAIPEVYDPSPAQPVTATMLPDHTKVHAGDRFQLLVRVRIAGGFHIYSTNTPHGPFSPTRLSLVLPDELEAVGDWAVPAPTVTRSGERVYTDSVLFRRPMRIRLNAATKQLFIEGELLCQACNQDLCFPARQFSISAFVAAVSNANK
jgi:DsbC/DsbD-like thiol-disulfide interchange protein